MRIYLDAVVAIGLGEREGADNTKRSLSWQLKSRQRTAKSAFAD